MSKRSISNIIFHNAATEIANGIEYECSIATSACIEIISEGTFTAVFEGKSLGDIWYNLTAIKLSTLDITSQATTTGLYLLDLYGLTNFRVRLSAVGSNPVTVLGKMEG